MKTPVKSLMATLCFIVLALSAAYPQASTTKAESLYTIDATGAPTPPEFGYLQMGEGLSPSGRILSVNSRYLMMDGKPWLPVMGEFHYSRYPERYWEEEILKMKAGGVQIVSTYVFWIHHEEVEGQFDWSGQRNLRKFVELCASHGMYVYPRIGPWDHGEVRNGGFPDWLLKKGPTRVNDPIYLSYVRRLYDEVGLQLKGLLWKDGGPVIGIQLENEYANRAVNGGAAYISQLKKMAIEAHLDVPLYTVTGWDNAVYPPREVIPVFGGYPDEPWSGSLKQLPPDTQGVYQFHLTPITGNAGILQGKSDKIQATGLWHYPRFTVELGAGMQLTYHRRLVVDENDISPMAITALGSGVNMLGYYMFQGGMNPQGKLTTLQESQATDYPNDVPVKSYDFQAPLGAYGQMNRTFRKLKVIHQFIADFGSDLAPMTAILPDTVPSGPQDTTTLRLAARTDGNRAFLFFNNYLRNYPIPEQKSVQVIIKLANETIIVPREPVNISTQTAFVWPVNMNLGGASLTYATAQPFAKIHDQSADYYFFSTSPGIASEFAFADSSLSSVKSPNGKISRVGDRATVAFLQPSTGVAIELQTKKETTIRIVLLSPEQAANSWKLAIHGQDHLLMTSADVFSDGDSIHLRSRDPSALSLSIFPPVDQLNSTVPLQKTADDGLFTRYTASVSSSQIQVAAEKVKDAAPSDPIKMGKVFDWRSNAVAEAPDDSQFAKAAVWRLTLPKDAWKTFEDVFLDINYVGDVGRLYKGETLLDDNFYNGTPWEIGMKRYPPEDLEKFELRILPLRKDAPIYMPDSSWPNFDSKSDVAEIKSITASPEYEVVLNTR